MLYITWEIADNIQINKVIGENEQCVFVLWKKPYEHFDQANINILLDYARNIL